MGLGLTHVDYTAFCSQTINATSGVNCCSTWPPKLATSFSTSTEESTAEPMRIAALLRCKCPRQPDEAVQRLPGPAAAAPAVRAVGAGPAGHRGAGRVEAAASCPVNHCAACPTLRSHSLLLQANHDPACAPFLNLRTFATVLNPSTGEQTTPEPHEPIKKSLNRIQNMEGHYA